MKELINLILYTTWGFAYIYCIRLISLKRIWIILGIVAADLGYYFIDSLIFGE